MSIHSPVCPTSPSDSKSSVRSIQSHPSILSDPIADGSTEIFNKEVEDELRSAEEEDEEFNKIENLESRLSKSGRNEAGRTRRTEGPKNRPRGVKPTGIPISIKLAPRKLSLKKAIFMLPIS